MDIHQFKMHISHTMSLYKTNKLNTFYAYVCNKEYVMR